MTLKQKKLESYKAELLSRRNQIALDLQTVNSEFLEDEPAYSDALDQASVETAKSLTLRIKNKGRDALWEIQDALRRIEEGSFGECERCGDDISEARMRARPSAIYCVACQSEIEVEEGRHQAYRL